MTNTHVDMVKPVDNQMLSEKKCMSCGAQLISGAKFCPECGKRVERICRNCGTKLLPDAKFCLECGSKVE